MFKKTPIPSRPVFAVAGARRAPLQKRASQSSAAFQKCLAFCPYAFVFFAFVFCASAQAAVFSVEASDIAAEIRAAREEGRRLAVLVELPDCPDCLAMKRGVFSDPAVEKDFGRRYRTRWIRFTSASPVVDADGKRRAPEELARAWGVFAAPSFVFFDAKGHLEYRHTGSLLRPADFLALGRFVSDAIYERQPFSDYLHRQLTPVENLRPAMGVN